MIDVNNAIHLNISKKNIKIISTILISFTVFVALALIWILYTKKEIGEDWLLTLVAVLPATLIISASWAYIILAKKSLNPDELLQETSRVLSIELPKTIAKRIIYYTELRKDGYFHSILSGKKIITDIKHLENNSLLNTSELQAKIKECKFEIESNVTTGTHSCLYKIRGEIINDYPLLKHLTIGVQINVSQVEVTYDFEETPCDMLNITKKTRDGAEAVGYDVRTYPKVENESMKDQEYTPDIYKNNNGDDVYKFKIKARLKSEKENTNLLLDSSYKLFIIQDISVMTGYLISALEK